MISANMLYRVTTHVTSRIIYDSLIKLHSRSPCLPELCSEPSVLQFDYQYALFLVNESA